jgi:hypothetical protein
MFPYSLNFTFHVVLYFWVPHGVILLSYLVLMPYILAHLNAVCNYVFLKSFMLIHVVYLGVKACHQINKSYFLHSSIDVHFRCFQFSLVQCGSKSFWTWPRTLSPFCLLCLLPFLCTEKLQFLNNFLWLQDLCCAFKVGVSFIIGKNGDNKSAHFIQLLSRLSEIWK